MADIYSLKVRERPVEDPGVADRLEVLNRLMLMLLSGSDTVAPTRELPTVAGNTITTAYSRIYFNDGLVLVGWECEVDWGTPGAAIRFSREASDSAKLQDLSNAGSAGTLTRRVWVPPGGGVHAKDNGGGVSPLGASDVLRQRICDPTDLVRDRYWGRTAATR